MNTRHFKAFWQMENTKPKGRFFYVVNQGILANQRDGSFGLFWSVLTELLFTTTYCHHTNSQIIAREKNSDQKNRPFGLQTHK